MERVMNSVSMVDSNEEFDHYLHVNHVLYSLRLISNSNKALI